MTKSKAEKRSHKKRRKMNWAYKVAIVLFAVAVLLMFCATALMLLKTAKQYTTYIPVSYDFEFLSTLAGMAASGFAFIGIIFACFSKSKKKNKMVMMTVVGGTKELEAVKLKTTTENTEILLQTDESTAQKVEKTNTTETIQTENTNGTKTN